MDDGHTLQDASAAYRLRYGAETALPPPPAWNATLDLLLGHRSVRAFLPDALPAGALEALVAAASSAASSSNLQTWSVVAVEDVSAREKLAVWSGNQRHIVDAPLILIFVADLARAGRIAAAEGRPAEALASFELTLVATVDAALAAQNTVIAAESLGLGTVYIGAIRNRIEDVARLIALPAGAYPVFGLVVGRPDPSRPAAVKPRLEQAVVLHRERYDATGEAERIAAYAERMAAFQVAEGMAPERWPAKIANRVATLAGLHGREHLRAALAALGLPMR